MKSSFTSLGLASLRALVIPAIRRLTGNVNLRATIGRIILRADEIVPFGRELAFDHRTWVIKQTEYGFRIWVALGERSISREIMLDRYERDEAAFVRATVQPGDHVVDVGANIGFYTALLATLVGPRGKVVACEPLAAVAQALERTVAENNFGDRVVVHRVALDAKAGSVNLRHAPMTTNQGGAYIASASPIPPDHLDTVVPARTLDELLGEEPCAFIKLDAEGAEPRILSGASRTLARCQPIVLAELNPVQLERVGQKSANDILTQMAAFGYVARRFHGSVHDVIERYDEAATINVVFAPTR